MATEQIDGIEFYVDVDTAGAVSSTKVIDNTTKKIEGSFKKLDTQVTKTSKGVNTGLASMGRGAGQVGVQLQQLVGQIQGGQNAAQAFAAQAADIGIVMGAPLLGVLAAFGFAIGGPLLSSLGVGTSAIKELDKATDALKDTIKETDGGVTVFTESIVKLAEKSEAAARIELALGLTKTKDAIKAAKKEVNEATESWESWLSINENTDNAVAGLAALDKAAKKMGVSQAEALNQLGNTYKGTILGIGDLNDASEDLSEKLGLTTEQSLKFFKAVAAFRKDKSVDSMKALSGTMAELSVNIEKPNKKLIELASRISKATLKAGDAEEAQKLFNSALKGFDVDNVVANSEKFIDSTDSVINSLNAQFIALGQGEEAAFRYATAQQLGLKVGEQIPANVDAQITALFKLKKAQDDAAQAERARNQEETNKKSLSGKVQGLGLSQEDQIRARLDSELELLRLAQEQKIEIEGSYEERRVELRRKAEERIRAINEKSTQESSINFEALENQIVGTFASVASGAQSGKEAVRSLAQSIATQLIGSLIKMGIQAAIGQTTAAATGVATAATLSAAYATPAALASLASFGSNAAPAAAGIASTVGLAQGLSLAGGRESGGPVTKGRLYEVGEKNKPEMLQSGGKQYMIPGNNGNVISNKDLNSSGSGIQVIINNNAPGVSVSATESSDSDGRMRQIAIQVVSEQSAALGSELNRNINKNHNVTNRQGANRRN